MHQLVQRIEFEKVLDLPSCEEAFSLVRCAVSDRGSGLFLFVEDLAKDEVHGMDRDSFAAFPKTRMENPSRLKLIELASNESREVELPPLDMAFPLVDVFPDGRVLVAGARCRYRGPGDYDRNGAVYDPSNGELSRILLGDGIADLAIDARGWVWISYFDEGVFGNYGWGSRGHQPIGSHGLNCFDDTGEILWRFSGAGDFGEIDDCYALNVQDATAAVFYYTEFPLCLISGEFEKRCFKTGLRGCRSFAINGSTVLFARQYKEPASTAHLGKLLNGEVGCLERVEIGLPDGSLISSGQLLGRGGDLHYFDDDAWYRFKLSQLAECA